MPAHLISRLQSKMNLSFTKEETFFIVVWPVSQTGFSFKVCFQSLSSLQLGKLPFKTLCGSCLCSQLNLPVLSAKPPWALNSNCFLRLPPTCLYLTTFVPLFMHFSLPATFLLLPFHLSVVYLSLELYPTFCTSSKTWVHVLVFLQLEVYFIF